jgi:hypothetical protein
MTAEELKTLLVTELRGPRCRCGIPKMPGRTFCRKCYYALSEAVRKALYKRAGHGYEEAYTAAVRDLAALGRVEFPEWLA